MKTNIKILIGGLTILVGFLTWFGVQSQIRLNEERDRVTKYYELSQKYRVSEESLKIRYDSISVVLQKYQYIVDSLETVVMGNDHQISYLNKELNKALDDLKYTNPSSDYEWLKTRYMFSANDTLKFVFHGGEVKAITKEVVEGLYLDSLYTAQIDISLLQESQLLYKDEIINTLKGERDDMNVLAQSLHDQLVIKLEDLEALEQDNDDLKKTLKLWQGGALGGGAFLLLLLLL